MKILTVVQENPISYEKLKNCILDNEQYQNFDNEGNTPLIILCLNPSITYEILELIINSLDYTDLIIKNKNDTTALMYLCNNESITYEMLQLIIDSLDYNDLITNNLYGTTALINLCTNTSITYKMLNLFIDKLNYNDIIIEDYSELKFSALKLLLDNIKTLK